MKKYLVCFMALLILPVLFSCKKDKSQEPVIVITSPNSGQSFIPGDTIHVEADISDDGDLPSVTLKLLNAAYTSVDHPESFAINSSSYHLSFDYVIENIYLQTGNYFITVTTSDGDHDRNEYRAIVINELPRTRKAVYVLTSPNSSTVAVSLLDSLSQLSFRFNVQGDYAGSVINSRYSRLNIAGITTGDYNQFDLTNNSNIFSFPVYNNGLPSFQDLFPAHDLTFVTFYDGRILAFDKDGNIQFNAAQPINFQPGTLCVNDIYVFTEAYYQIPGETRLVVLFYPSGSIRQEFDLEMDIVSMASLDNNSVMVFANNNTDGKILLYNVISNGVNDFHTIFNKTINDAIPVHDGSYAIATSGGLYNYEESSNNLVPVDMSEPVYSLEYDDVNGILFANTGRKIKEYAFPQPGVINLTHSADSVLEVRVLYNR